MKIDRAVSASGRVVLDAQPWLELDSQRIFRRRVVQIGAAASKNRPPINQRVGQRQPRGREHVTLADIEKYRIVGEVYESGPVQIPVGQQTILARDGAARYRRPAGIRLIESPGLLRLPCDPVAVGWIRHLGDSQKSWMGGT